MLLVDTLDENADESLPVGSSVMFIGALICPVTGSKPAAPQHRLVDSWVETPPEA